MATHRAPARDTANPTLAYLSILLGATSMAGSWLPWPAPLLTIAATGVVTGLLGIWWSRQIAAGVGVVLSGTAMVLIVMFHTGLGGWLAAAEQGDPPPDLPVMLLNGDCR